eukprot:14270316-Alexandrium_andersonii.AAC.1
MYRTTKWQKRSSKVGVVKKSVSATGKVRITGGPALKKTQVYPSGFGRAVAKLFLKRQASLHEEAKSELEKLEASGIKVNLRKIFGPLEADALWEAAGMQSVLDMLSE